MVKILLMFWENHVRIQLSTEHLCCEWLRKIPFVRHFSMPLVVLAHLSQICFWGWTRFHDVTHRIRDPLLLVNYFSFYMYPMCEIWSFLGIYYICVCIYIYTHTHFCLNDKCVYPIQCILSFSWVSSVWNPCFTSLQHIPNCCLSPSHVGQNLMFQKLDGGLPKSWYILETAGFPIHITNDFYDHLPSEPKN